MLFPSFQGFYNFFNIASFYLSFVLCTVYLVQIGSVVYLVQFFLISHTGHRTIPHGSPSCPSLFPKPHVTENHESTTYCKLLFIGDSTAITILCLYLYPSLNIYTQVMHSMLILAYNIFQA